MYCPQISLKSNALNNDVRICKKKKEKVQMDCAKNAEYKHVGTCLLSQKMLSFQQKQVCPL